MAHKQTRAQHLFLGVSRHAKRQTLNQYSKLGYTCGMENYQYATMGVEQLATIRDYGLQKVHVVTEALKDRVREEHANGVTVKKLSRQAGVTPATIYAWVADK